MTGPAGDNERVPGWRDGARRAWNRIRPRSIRARVTVGALLVLFLITAMGMFATNALIREAILTQARERVAEEARVVSEHVSLERYPGPVPEGDYIVRTQVVDRDSGEVLAASDLLEGRPQLTAERPAEGDHRLDTIVCGTDDAVVDDACLLVVGYSLDDTAYGDVMVLAASRLPAVTGIRTPEALLVVMSLNLLTATGLVLWYGVGRALRPVEEISAELDTISAQDLHRRLPVPRSQDEISHLARTANATLERLEEAATRQRRFVSDASHELRNPIAALRTKLEVEVSDPDPDPRTRELLLTSLLSDVERLENIVNDLLELARLDTGTAMELQKVDLAALVEEEFVDRHRAPVLTVHSSGPVHAEANRLRMVRVLTNLVANARRHADSRIDVIVRREEGYAVVEVHDDGAGIPPGERERIFERFARLRESRERDPGSGLGLPISREIVRAHGGSLVAGHSDLLGGAAFTLRVPERPVPSEEAGEPGAA